MPNWLKIPLTLLGALLGLFLVGWCLWFIAGWLLGDSGVTDPARLIELRSDLVRTMWQGILAAGGVGCGRQVAAALMLGAQGVWTGTAWLTAREHDIAPKAQAKILAARSEDTIRSNWGDGAYRRHVTGPLDLRWLDPDAPPILPRPMQSMLTRELTLQIADNEVEEVYYPIGTGQGAGLLDEVKPARQIMEEWANECLEAFEERGMLS